MKRRYTAALLALAIVLGLVPLAVAANPVSGKATKDSPETYTVTFKLKDGTVVKKAEKVPNNTILTEPEECPTKDGYELNGWYKNEACTNKWDFAKDKVTADTTIYAKWDKLYNIKFDLNDRPDTEGDPIKDQKVAEGKTATEPEPKPTWNGHRFDGWYKEKECNDNSKCDFDTYKIIADTTLYAKWTKLYNVRFDLNGGPNTEANKIEDQEVASGEKATEPQLKPERNGYRFDGWYKENECKNKCIFTEYEITADTILYAKWLEIFTVEFDLNGGTGNIDDQKVPNGEEAEEPKTDPTLEGYRFDGWYNKKNNKEWDFTKGVTENTTLYAKWIELFTVKFDLNGGTGKISDQEVADGKTATEPEVKPKRDGYRFDSWYKDKDGVEKVKFAEYNIIADTTLFANWIKVYKVTFDMNGGTGSVSEKEIDSGDLISRPNDPTKTGYKFDGWYNKKDDKLWDFANHKVNEDITLYAKWRQNSSGDPSDPSNPGGSEDNKDECKVTFDLKEAEGVTAPDVQTVKKGEKVSKPTDPVWEGHTFGGWYTDADCTTAWDFDNGTVTGDMTLYAKWTDGTGENPSPDASKSLPDAIRYVPWSVDLNKYDIFAGGKDYKLTNEPSWMRNRKGVIGGVPQSSRTETFTITYTNKDGAEVKEAVKIEVRSASSSNLSDLSDEHWDYRITDPTGNVYGYNGGCHLTSRGDYDEFRDLYLDGDELDQGTDYDVWRGSTVIEIYPRALRRAGYGSHTVALAFQDDDGTLHCVAQNFSIKRNDSSDDDDDYDGSGLRLTINNRKGGTVSNLSNGSITIRPRSGYRIESVLVNGKSVSVPSNGKLTGLRSRDRVEVTFEEITSSTMTPNSVNSIWAPPDGMTGTDGAWLGFRDVSPEAYYYSAVQWAVNNNVTKGKGNRSFQPNGTCTRAEMVTFLWRACGSPEPSGGGKRFTDVPGNAYYTKAVQWAADKSLVKGEGKRRFNPDALVTRGEAVTFLYRSAGSPSAPSAVKFEDVNNGAFYLKPVSWALNNGIADGVSSAYFRPERPCTRAEVMTFLFRRYQQ